MWWERATEVDERVVERAVRTELEAVLKARLLSSVSAWLLETKGFFAVTGQSRVLLLPRGLGERRAASPSALVEEVAIVFPFRSRAAVQDDAWPAFDARQLSLCLSLHSVMLREVSWRVSCFYAFLLRTYAAIDQLAVRRLLAVRVVIVLVNVGRAFRVTCTRK